MVNTTILNVKVKIDVRPLRINELQERGGSHNDRSVKSYCIY